MIYLKNGKNSNARFVLGIEIVIWWFFVIRSYIIISFSIIRDAIYIQGNTNDYFSINITYSYDSIFGIMTMTEISNLTRLLPI